MGKKKKKSKTKSGFPFTEIGELAGIFQTQKNQDEDSNDLLLNHVLPQQDQTKECIDDKKDETENDTQQRKKTESPFTVSQNTVSPREMPCPPVDVVQQPKPIEKSRKVITTKTFTKGLMDVSLLTSNASQLRSVLLDPEHPFYTLVCTLIVISISLQVTSTLLMLMSDYYKTHTTKDEDNSQKRKRLNFISMAAISLVTVANVLISAFHVPGDMRKANVKNTF